MQCYYAMWDTNTATDMLLPSSTAVIALSCDNEGHKSCKNALVPTSVNKSTGFYIYLRIDRDPSLFQQQVRYTYLKNNDNISEIWRAPMFYGNTMSQQCNPAHGGALIRPASTNFDFYIAFTFGYLGFIFIIASSKTLHLI